MICLSSSTGTVSLVEYDILLKPEDKIHSSIHIYKLDGQDATRSCRFNKNFVFPLLVFIASLLGIYTADMNAK